MPDGFGDDLTPAELANWGRRSIDLDDGLQDSHAPVARLCLELGLGRRKTLQILGAKQNARNFKWLEQVTA